MALELEYDRSLYGKEHEAGPFDVTEDMIISFNQSISQMGACYNDRDAAVEAGYRGIIAPPTLCTLFVRRVELPDINLKFIKPGFMAVKECNLRLLLWPEILLAHHHI